ncbi:uncharacterized protein FIBRA_01141 [Fibroporia radiculosa]|uniref:G domain-containing protein n=1 Tax=Fibroporia radiculosa TaxID=599839 RepID=J4HSU1_9APHY|nr:uncharacterized protein FIBRA_01141 [Fibroporia radiculosa]CCL99127.1 predicted protein [Fibroporia radiculosa]
MFVEPRYILLMGPSGTGKTRFINILAGTKLPEGHNLEPCTRTVECTTVMLDGQPVVLIDTPGLDGDYNTSKITRAISTYLRTLYKENKDLVGIVYMHRISDNRINTTTTRCFDSFHQICGEEAMYNVAVVTNMWELVEKSRAEQRVQDLIRTSYYGKATEHGAQLLHHDNTSESAKHILRNLLNKEPVQLQCQKWQPEVGPTNPDTRHRPRSESPKHQSKRRGMLRLIPCISSKDCDSPGDKAS